MRRIRWRSVGIRWAQQQLNYGADEIARLFRLFRVRRRGTRFEREGAIEALKWAIDAEAGAVRMATVRLVAVETRERASMLRLAVRFRGTQASQESGMRKAKAAAGEARRAAPCADVGFAASWPDGWRPRPGI